MVRLEVRLTGEQVRRLRVVAAEHSVSVAAVVRDAVDRYLSAADRARAIASTGGFRSGRSNVAEAHDESLADAFGR